jgi:imidazolonepropionase
VAPERTPVDLVLVGASELATPVGSRARGGADLGAIRVVRDGAVAISGDRIVAVGEAREIAARYSAARELDADGGTIVPGFVDAHTHPVFAGTREDEFEMRTRGASYAEIAAKGGGILSTVRGVRAASSEELLARVLLNLDRFLEHGTTTVEAKSGYGLDASSELKCLEVLAAAGRTHPVEVVPTFLGAHDVPEEHRANPQAYVALVLEEMLPRVAEMRLAEYCDVFVERGFFDVDSSRRILERAKDLGLGLRLHADQLSCTGAAELAAELGAASADHLEHASPRGIEALLRAGVVPVLCPVVPLFLRQEKEAPGRAIVDAGLAPAVSTDFNPGSCYLASLPEALAWAALRYRMTAGEALTAATLNAACSLGRGARLGSIEEGKQADLVVLDVPNHKHLVYELGRNPVRAVVKAGEIVLERPLETPRGPARGDDRGAAV